MTPCRCPNPTVQPGRFQGLIKHSETNCTGLQFWTFSTDGITMSTPTVGLKILIADDNPVNLLVARKMVEKMGHTPTTACNGKEAVDLLRVSQFDIVLMDCHMPVMDGYEATKAIRQQPDAWARIPIVAVTASATPGDRELCLRAGMNDYVTKPVNAQALRKAIDLAAAMLLPG
ncbi:MAG: response regulator, partial [Proteobacteria bacterium]